MKKVLQYILAFMILGIPALILVVVALIFLWSLSVDILVTQGPKTLYCTYRDGWKDRNKWRCNKL